ncbi:class I SAM-dependent methyltransferase [Rhodovibrionaceae bacterium A322]
MEELANVTAKHFSDLAEAYSTSPGHAKDGDLDLVMAFSSPGLYEFALDVATGPGHTAFRLASRAAMVIGLDIAPGMLTKARELAQERDLPNLSFQYGDAAALPFGDDSFDLVTCRIAPHHFRDIPAFLTEVERVLKVGGRLVLEDSMAPEDPVAARFFHELEQRRDPTHVKSLSQKEWREACKDAGLTITRDVVFPKRHAFRQWLSRTGFPAREVSKLEQELLAAPRMLQDRFFEVEDGSIITVKDEKLIFRADKR